MKYVIGLERGIEAIDLIPGFDVLGELSYFLDAKTDNYYPPETVFNDYDEALAGFCNLCASKIASLQKQIKSINTLKDQVRES